MVVSVAPAPLFRLCHLSVSPFSCSLHCSTSGNLAKDTTCDHIREHFHSCGVSKPPPSKGRGLSIAFFCCSEFFVRAALNMLCFAVAVADVKDVRLLTKKGTNEPRGCAFVEFHDSTGLWVRVASHTIVAHSTAIDCTFTHFHACVRACFYVSRKDSSSTRPCCLERTSTLNLLQAAVERLVHVRVCVCVCACACASLSLSTYAIPTFSINAEWV